MVLKPTHCKFADQIPMEVVFISDSTSTVTEKEKLKKFKQILGLKWRTTSCVHSRIHTKNRICGRLAVLD